MKENEPKARRETGPMTHRLYNTETEEIEAVQPMGRTEAAERNKALMENDEPQRWLPYYGDDED